METPEARRRASVCQLGCRQSVQESEKRGESQHKILLWNSSLPPKSKWLFLVNHHFSICFPYKLPSNVGQFCIFPVFFPQYEKICQAKADKVPQPEPFGDPTTVMLRHIPNRSDRVSDIFAPSIKGTQQVRSFDIRRFSEQIQSKYMKSTIIMTKWCKRVSFLHLSSNSWSHRYTSVQLVELLDAKGFKARMCHVHLFASWPDDLYWFLKLQYRLLVLDDYWMLIDFDGCCGFMAGQIRLRVPTNRFPEQGQPRVSPCFCCSVAMTLCSHWHCLLGGSNFTANQVLLCKSSFPWMGSPIQTGLYTQKRL